MGDLLFKLRYLPTANGKMNNAAREISRFMGEEMGLMKNINYATEPWWRGINNSFEELLEHSEGILLEIYSENPFGFQEGFLGGYRRIWDFLEKNKWEIKNTLKLIENGN